MEHGELIHAIVDRGQRLEFVRQRQRHWRVEPQYVILQVLRFDEFAYESAEVRHLFITEARRVGRSLRPAHKNIRFGIFEFPFEMLRTPGTWLLYKNYTVP